MARRRWIDPSFWDDEEIGDLSFPQRIFFVGCWSNADDEGRLRGNPVFLRGEIFRYDDLSLEDVVEIRDAVLRIMPRSLAMYEANDREYLAFDEKHWRRYQNPNHPRASTLPTPPSDLFGDTKKEERRPMEERQKPEGQPQEDGKKPTDMDRIGLDRIGKDRVAKKPRKRGNPESRKKLKHWCFEKWRQVFGDKVKGRPPDIDARDAIISFAESKGEQWWGQRMEYWKQHPWSPWNFKGMMNTNWEPSDAKDRGRRPTGADDKQYLREALREDG